MIIIKVNMYTGDQMMLIHRYVISRGVARWETFTYMYVSKLKISHWGIFQIQNGKQHTFVLEDTSNFENSEFLLLQDLPITQLKHLTSFTALQAAILIV